MKKFLGIVLFGFLFLFVGLQSSVLADTGRINGADRYSTAVETSKAGWSSSDTVVIANGLSFPDALAGGPLAYYYDAPILLTEAKRLTEVTQSEIRRLKAKNVIVLGGNVVVSDQVVTKLKGMGLTVKRIGGSDRFDTAAKIAGVIPSTKAVIANGFNFPDALSVAPYAARKEIPILLTRKDALPKATIKALNGKTSTIVVGGTGVVSANVAKQLPPHKRYGGEDRFETGLLINKHLPLRRENAYVATGMNFADALTGSVLAAKNNAPILLVRTTSIPSSTKAQVPSYKTITIFGGEVAVSERVRKEIDGEISTFSARGISIGDSKTTVTNMLGKPNRIDVSREGFDWYIYNSDYKKYLQVAMKDRKVVSLASNAKVWESTNGLNIGSSSKKVEQVLGKNPYNDVYLIDDQYYITFYYDQHKDNTVSLIKLTDKTIESYGVKVDEKRLIADMEKEVFDLANATRVQYGLKPYVWDSKVAKTARKHSQDMVNRNYVDHNNPDGKSPWERMEEDGIRYKGAAENIAAGYGDALSVHMGWMNSAGHRSNLLSSLERLGVGAAFGGDYGIYWTQKFYTPM